MASRVCIYRNDGEGRQNIRAFLGRTGIGNCSMSKFPVLRSSRIVYVGIHCIPVCRAHNQMSRHSKARFWGVRAWLIGFSFESRRVCLRITACGSWQEYRIVVGRSALLTCIDFCLLDLFALDALDMGGEAVIFILEALEKLFGRYGFRYGWGALTGWDCGKIKVCGLEMPTYLCMCSSMPHIRLQRRTPTVRLSFPKLGRGNWYYAAITNEKETISSPFLGALSCCTLAGVRCSLSSSVHVTMMIYPRLFSVG